MKRKATLGGTFDCTLYLSYIIDSSSNAKPITKCHDTTCSYVVKKTFKCLASTHICGWHEPSLPFTSL